MRIYIKNIQLFISLILFPFGIINFLYFLCRDFIDGPFRLKFMTWWNLYINSIYFIVVLICDISLYFNNRKMEKINFFFREHFSPIYFPEKIKNKNSNEFGTFYENFYVHFLITIIQILDIFFAQKTFMKFNFNHFIALTILFFNYGIVVAYEKFVNKNAIYPFFNDLKWWNFPFFIVFFVVCYYLIYKYCYLKLIEIKYEKKFFVFENEIESNNNVNLK